jgi:hypothetical protein
VLSFPVFIVALKTNFPLFHQFKFVFPDFFMAPEAVISSRKMQLFHLFKFRMTLRGSTVVGKGSDGKHH